MMNGLDLGVMLALLQDLRGPQGVAGVSGAQMDAWPDFAFVHPTLGNDAPDPGRGSMARPYRTPQGAASVVMKDGTDQAGFLRPRHIVLAPGTHVGNVQIGTLRSANFHLMGGCVWTGHIQATTSSAKRFASASSPRIGVYGDSRIVNSFGDAVDAIKLVGTAADNTGFTLDLRGLFISGLISDDANISLSTNAIEAIDCQVQGNAAAGFCFNTPRMGFNRCRNVIFTRELNCYQLYGQMHGCSYLQRITVADTNGAPGNVISNCTMGLRNCFFSSSATVKQIVMPAGAALRLDNQTNYQLKHAGWSVTPNTVVVALQEDAVAIVPV